MGYFSIMTENEDTSEDRDDFVLRHSIAYFWRLFFPLLAVGFCSLALGESVPWWGWYLAWKAGAFEAMLKVKEAQQQLNEARFKSVEMTQKTVGLIASAVRDQISKPQEEASPPSEGGAMIVN
jgi:hypothetical protein